MDSNRFDLFSPHIELIFYKTYADLRAETERTYLGFLWWIFEPVMYTTVFYLVFGIAMGHHQDDFVPFLLIGLTAWQWMKSCLSHGSESILGYRGLMQYVHLPKIIFPTILILTDTVKFLFIFTVLLAYLWLSGHSIGISYIALIPLLLIQLLFTAGMTYLLAAVVPFLPDLRFVVEQVLQAIFFGTGIFFAGSSLPEKYHFYFYLNPMASLIEGYRQILLHNAWPDWDKLFLVEIFSIFIVIAGVRLISHFEYTYPKVTI